MPEKLIVQISDDPVGLETNSLANWLRDDGDVSSTSFSVVSSRPEKGEMGAIADALQLILDPATVSAAVNVLVAWLATRRPHTKMIIKTERGEVQIESSDITSADASSRRILRELRR
jgi:hypothetical protein